MEHHNSKSISGDIHSSSCVSLSGMGLLHWACDGDKLDVVKHLLDKGADINILDADNQTPLHYASSCGNAEIVKCLLQHRANQDIADSSGETALQVAESEDIRRLFS